MPSDPTVPRGSTQGSTPAPEAIKPSPRPFGCLGSTDP